MLKTLLILPFIASILSPSSNGALNVYSRYKISTAEREKTLINSDETILLKVPYTHQYEDLPDDQKPFIRKTACGPAAIAMALNSDGREISLIDVINKLPESVYRKGDRFYNLTKAPEYFSEMAVEIENSPKAIFDTLKSGNPIVLNIQNYDGVTGHAVVVVGMSGFNGNTADYLIIHDPYVGPYRTFKYINPDTLQQPEGYYNSIGILKPFYIEDGNVALDQTAIKTQ